MKKLTSFRRLALSLALTAAALLTFNAKATVVLLNGNSYTNLNVPLNASPTGTNSSGVVTNNYQLGMVPGSSNVLWTLSTSPGAQLPNGSNGLPALVFKALGGFQNSLTAPTRQVSIELGGVLTATNATSTAIVFRFAATGSGINWYTNYASFTYTIPVNSTGIATGCLLTNIDVGGTPYIALQEIDNPGAAALTNIVINIAGKSGL